MELAASETARKSVIGKSRARTRHFISEAICSVCIRQLLRFVLCHLLLFSLLMTINPLTAEVSVADNQNSTKTVSYNHSYAFDYARGENTIAKEKTYASTFGKMAAKSIILGKQKRRKVNEKSPKPKPSRTTSKIAESNNFERMIFNFIRNSFKQPFYEPMPGIEIKLKDNSNSNSNSTLMKSKRRRSSKRYTDGEITVDVPRAISTGRLLFFTGNLLHPPHL